MEKNYEQEMDHVFERLEKLIREAKNEEHEFLQGIGIKTGIKLTLKEAEIIVDYYLHSEYYGKEDR